MGSTKYRAYEPGLGRWISRDPIEETDGLNLYGYVSNDPFNNANPLGLAPKDKYWGKGGRDFRDWMHGQKGKGDPDFTREQWEQGCKDWEAAEKPKKNDNKGSPKTNPSPVPPPDPEPEPDPDPEKPFFTPPPGSGDAAAAAAATAAGAAGFWLFLECYGWVFIFAI